MARRRVLSPQEIRRQRILETVCVLVVIAAIVALVVFIVQNAGGGVINLG